MIAKEAGIMRLALELTPNQPHALGPLIFLSFLYCTWADDTIADKQLDMA